MTTRRKLLKSLALGTGGWIFTTPSRILERLARPAAFLGPRSGRANPFLNNQGRARLVCIEGSDVPTMLRKGLQALGGLERLVKDGDRVFLKPNLVLRESDPGAPLFPTMSSPDCIRELIWLLRNHTNQIQVGDQGGEAQGLIYESLGLPNVVNGAGAELVYLEEMPDAFLSIRHPSWAPQVPDFQVFRALYEAPVLISLCNLKRHSSAHMTGAIKNNFGAMQGRWNLGTRGWLHRNPNLSEAFLAELPYVAALMRPELTIVDARHIMIGNGPLLSSPGAQIRTGINRMVMAGDPVALDSYCAQRILAKHDPEFEPESIRLTLSNAEQLGLGTSQLSRVEILEIDETWEPSPKKGTYRR